jgi:large subunit ribosomal protein L31
MRKDIHPENYRLVAFKDMSNDDVFITKSTAETKETLEVDGVAYPLIKLEISRTSHPYYTGKAKLVDTAGRIDKFKNKYDKFKKPAAAKTAPETAAQVAEAPKAKVEETKASAEEE